MKNTKKLITLVILGGLMLVGFQSCSQYPENTEITLVSRIDRVSKIWQVDNYRVNGTDFTSLMSAYTETFTKQGTYSYQWAILGGTATWAFQNNNAEIKITGTSNVSTKTLVILKLENKAFWYYYIDGTDRKELHLILK